jgi:hypothetical protein
LRVRERVLNHFCKKLSSLRQVQMPLVRTVFATPAMAMGVRALLESIEFIPGNPTALLKVVLAAELVLKALDSLVSNHSPRAK